IKLTRSNSNQVQEPPSPTKAQSPKSKMTTPAGNPSSKPKRKLGKLTPVEGNAIRSQEPVRLQKQNFRFNQKYWDQVNPHKAEAIKKKYGIEGTTVDPHKVHHPVKPKMQKPVKKENLNELR